VIFRSRLFGDFHLPSSLDSARPPCARRLRHRKNRLAHLVPTRPDWRMLPFRLIVQVTSININGTACILRLSESTGLIADRQPPGLVLVIYWLRLIWPEQRALPYQNLNLNLNLNFFFSIESENFSRRVRLVCTLFFKM
jgi:hypothetical protein